MNQKEEESLYKGALQLLMKEGTRFTVDDLSHTLHLAKKTIYALTPSKSDLAKWIYGHSFISFEKALDEAEDDPDVGSPAFRGLLDAYGALLSICQEGTFNRYSLDPAIKDSSMSGFAKEQARMKSFLHLTNLKGFLSNPAFFPSFEASLRVLRENEESDTLVKGFQKILESLSC